MQVRRLCIGIMACVTAACYAHRANIWNAPEVHDTTKQINLSSKHILHIRNDYGSVRVTSGDTHKPRIHAYIYGPEGYTEYVTIEEEPDNKQHVVYAQLGEIPQNEDNQTQDETEARKRKTEKKKTPTIADFYIDYYVTLPAQAGISVGSENKLFFEANDVNGHIGVAGNNTYTSITRAGSSVSVQVEKGDTTVDTAQGYVDTKTQSGTISLYQIQGNVNAMAHGAISAHNITGDAFLRSQRGHLDIKNVSGVINAYARDNVDVTQSELSESTTIFVHTRHGVNLYLPRSIHSYVHATTTKGIVTSDIPVTLEPMTTKLSREIWKQMRKQIEGTIGHGGAHITIDATSNIHIYELHQ